MPTLCLHFSFYILFSFSTIIVIIRRGICAMLIQSTVYRQPCRLKTGIEFVHSGGCLERAGRGLGEVGHQSIVIKSDAGWNGGE